MHMVHSIGNCYIGKLEILIAGNVGIRRVCNGCLKYLVNDLESRITHLIHIKYWHQGRFRAISCRKENLKFKNDIY
jgi:hypothetical protein